MSGKSELLSLTSVEMRRRIGSKEISPVELLEACIERIEAINPAVNAVTATAFVEGRKLAKAAEAAALKGEDLGLLHGLPTGIKDLEETKGLLTTHGSPLYRDNVPSHDAAMVDKVRKAGAVIVAKTNVPEFGAGANSRNVVWGATGNPFNPLLNPGRLVGRLGGGAGDRHAAGVHGLRHRWLAAHPRRHQRRRRLPAVARARRQLEGRARLGQYLGDRPDGPHGRRYLPAAGRTGRLGCHRPADLSDDPASLGVPRDVDLGSLRVAWTEDFGQCPVETPIRKVMRDRIGAMRHLFKSCDEVKFDFGEADRCFDVLRAIAFVQRYQGQYEKDKSLLGPNIRANYEIGAKMTIVDVAWAEAEQTRIYRRFQQTFRDYDLVLAPTVPVTPFPWTQLYLAEMEGKALRNYYHWLAPTYFITIVNNPAISIPCGVDHKGMPFGLQVIGEIRKDGDLLSRANALEQSFERIAALRRPRPDLGKLKKPTPELKSIVTHPPKTTEMG